MPPDSIRQLLTRTVDYAGLFPPAKLELKPALGNQASYGCSRDAWMLSTFVLPVSKFAEAAWFLSAFDDQNPLRISALGLKTTSGDEFIQELRSARKSIVAFAREHRQVVQIEQIEMPLPNAFDAETLHQASEVLGDLKLRAFWEARPNSASETIQLLSEWNACSGATAFGFKLRSGGVTADAFPSSVQIARALAAVMRTHVPIKFTAGLHHPLRMYREEVRAKMHGFLNVFGAGVLALEHGWGEEQIAAVLEDEDAKSFRFSDAGFSWQKWEVASETIEQHRRLITSFGSCSFDEPREDLQALGLL